MTGEGPSRRAVGALATLVAALVLVALAVQVTSGEARLAGTNAIHPVQPVAQAEGPVTICQEQETLFEATAGLVVVLEHRGAGAAPPVAATVRRDGRVLARGRLAPGWASGSRTIALAPEPQRSSPRVEVCLEVEGHGNVAAAGLPIGVPTGLTVDGESRDGRISLRYLRAGQPSLLESAGLIARRYAHGAPGWLGPWTWGLMGLLVAGAVACAVLALRARRRGGTAPPAARWCTGCALALSLTWALLTPPFHVPDEMAHLAYVQALSEAGELPRYQPQHKALSEEAHRVLRALRFGHVIGFEDVKPPWTPGAEAAVRAAERTGASRETRDAVGANINPPLYYGLLAPVHAASRSAGLLDRMLLMRIVSCALAALTALFVYAFLMELLPRRDALWPLGALAVALQPMFTFIAGGVNPDGLLFAAAAATFWSMTLVLRRGLTRRRAAALGAALAVGALTKPLFLGLVPAALAALGLAAWRRRREGGRAPEVVAAVAIAVAVAVVPVVAFDLVGRASVDRTYLAAGVEGAPGAPGVLPEVPGRIEGTRARAFYAWQLFLPRLPGMNDRFPDTLPLRDVWFDGFLGRFGWLDHGFSSAVTDKAVWVGLGLLALFLLALVRARERLVRRWPEIACLLLALGGVTGAIGVKQHEAMLNGEAPLTQARYLLPLLPLYGAFVAIAASAVGRRAYPVAAILLVGLGVLHQLSALLLSIERYYA